MASVIHIAEIAAVLAVTYTIGWLLGYSARRVLQRREGLTTIPPERLAAVTAPPSPDLVTPPQIVPVVDPAIPAGQVPPEQASLSREVSAVPVLPPPGIPFPAESVRAEAVGPIPSESNGPDVAIAAPASPVDSLSYSAPRDAAPVPLSRFVQRLRATKDSSSELPPVEPLTLSPASRPGEAFSGEVRGRTHMALLASRSVSETSGLALAGASSSEDQGATAATAVAPAPPPDEDAAMRAIEGGWSRVRARALPDVPEFSDLGAAVAAAQSAVEQVLAQAGIEEAISSTETKPSGLPGPRLGARDDLKRINGLGELDESSLNNLGIFHFDQIAQWSETEVHWVENHVFAKGRVSGEDWLQQARRLSNETISPQAAFGDRTA